MNFDNIAGRILAFTSRLSVDAVLSTLQQNVAALDNVGDSLIGRANRAYSKAAELEKRGDEDTRNAARARRVASKLRDLID